MQTPCAKMNPSLHVMHPLKSIVEHVSQVEKHRDGNIVSTKETLALSVGSAALKAANEMMC